MKHLNLELAKLERRIAPGLTLLGVNLCCGGGGGQTSNGSSGSCDGTSASGSRSSKSKSHDSCSS